MRRSTAGAVPGGGGRQTSGYSGGYQQYGQHSGSSVLQQVRIAIQTGNLSRAEALLANFSDHNAEWHFLRGAVCYRRGWLDEAKRYYETAYQMEPDNPGIPSGIWSSCKAGHSGPIVPAADNSAQICAAVTSVCLFAACTLCVLADIASFAERWGGRKYD